MVEGFEGFKKGVFELSRGCIEFCGVREFGG